MNRYLIERRFPNGFALPLNAEGRTTCASMAEVNAALGVTWLHSYVSLDRRTVFCICDGPSVEAIREAAERNDWPLHAITPVSVLSPYFHRPD